MNEKLDKLVADFKAWLHEEQMNGGLPEAENIAVHLYHMVAKLKKEA